MPTFVYIAIFRGDPIDYQIYRHTSIWIKFESGQEVVIEVTGPPTAYSIAVQPGYDPTNTGAFAGLVEVGTLSNQVSPAQVSALAYETPPNNRESSYNCQTWVDEALTNMVRKGWLSEEQVSQAIDRMLEITMEAVDEPEPE